MGSRPQKLGGPLIDAAHVAGILASPQFVRSARMCRLLTLLVERANQPGVESIKETEVGVLVFDREVGYDPKVDSIVRTEANRFRRKLSEFYAGPGRTNSYRIHLPLGHYELEVLPNAQPVPVEPVKPEPARFPYRWA